MSKIYPRPDPRLWGKLGILAHQMPDEPTPAENLLWRRLRARQLSGFKFRRQHAIDRFIVDFYCSEAALVIEVDGEVHQQQVEADQEREQILKGFGFRVLRFTNAEVFEQMDGVLQQIFEALSYQSEH